MTLERGQEAASVHVLVPAGPEPALAATRESFSLVRGAGDRLSVLGQDDPAAGTLPAAPWVLLLGAGDRLEPGALEVFTTFGEALGADLVTCDRIEDGRIIRCPRWSERLFAQLPYTGRPVLLRRSLLERVQETGLGLEVLAGQEARSEWDLRLRLVEQAERVRHCPAVLVSQAGPVRTGSGPDRLEAVRGHLERRGLPGQVSLSPAGWPLTRVLDPQPVTVVVPTAFTTRRLADGTEKLLVRVLLESLRETAAHLVDQVVLVVDEASPKDLREACAALLPGQVQLVETTGPFNYAAAVNRGAAVARNELLLLVNDDVEARQAGWLELLQGALAVPGTSAVGPRLLFEDGRIQHAGVVCPPGALPLHPQIFEVDQPLEPLAQADVVHAAVTGACLLLRRSDWEAVGGMDERLPLNFNDVDLCLRLTERTGGEVCVVNEARLLHRESSTREVVLTQADREAYAAWRGRTEADPHIEYWPGQG